jgi:hypothetical protein
MKFQNNIIVPIVYKKNRDWESERPWLSFNFSLRRPWETDRQRDKQWDGELQFTRCKKVKRNPRE